MSRENVKKYSAALDFLEGAGIELAVSYQSVLYRSAMFCESRRVKYDEVIFVALHVREKLECIDIVRVVTFVTGKFRPMLASVRATAFDEESTESTLMKPPRMAYTEKPPV